MTRPTTSIDYPAIAAALGLRGSCVLHITTPVEEDVERPADRSDGALCVALTEAAGRWLDSPPRAILTVTHRASGLCLSSVAGPWLADKEGLRLAKMAAEVLRKAPGIDWTLRDPSRGGDTKLLLATLHELIAASVPPDQRASRRPPAS